MAFFLAPTAIALVPLALLAQHPQGLGSGWRDSAAARASSLANLAEILAERSPGTRDPNALYSIKPERVASLSRLADVLPHERVLSVVRDRPGLGLPDLGAFDSASPLASLFSDGPLTFGVPGLIVPTSTGDSPGQGGAPGGGGSPGFDSPFVPSAPVNPAEIPEPPVTSPVPEPATWLMTIAGFFAIAGALRRRRRGIPLAAPLRA